MTKQGAGLAGMPYGRRFEEAATRKVDLFQLGGDELQWELSRLLRTDGNPNRHARFYSVICRLYCVSVEPGCVGAGRKSSGR